MYSSVIVLCLMAWIFTHSNGNTTKATQSYCPVKPATDVRGPPGLPGRPGSKGQVREGQKGEKGDTTSVDDVRAEIAEIKNTISKIEKNISGIFDDLQSYNEALRAPNCSAFKAEPGWYNSGTNGKCFQYQKSSNEQSWQASRKVCQSKGGDLAHAGIRDLDI